MLMESGKGIVEHGKNPMLPGNSRTGSQIRNPCHGIGRGLEHQHFCLSRLNRVGESMELIYRKHRNCDTETSQDTFDEKPGRLVSFLENDHVVTGIEKSQKTGLRLIANFLAWRP